MAATSPIRIRMYNVGFGDCFLLTVPAPRRDVRILIDCGTHPSSSGPRRADRDVVPQLIEDLTQDGGRPRLDVVVATHRHKDHVSGFQSPLWADVEVGEVWLPWTEDPRDPEAKRILERQAKTRLALDDARQLLPQRNADAPKPGRGVALFGLASALMANFELTNEAAMTTLHTGFRGRPERRYLGAQKEPLTSAHTPGVTVHVLGPSRDEDVIRDLDPPRAESWRHLVEIVKARNEQRSDVRRPFDDNWSAPEAAFIKVPEFAHLRLNRQVVGAIRRLMGDELVFAAAALEKAVNGTSIVLAFEIGDVVLLFPGDAQWGTWKAILADKDWRRLIERAMFYKIGHHGSHNATPKSFVDDVLSRAGWAALPFAQVEIWKSIPEEKLLKALTEHHLQIVRSDQPGPSVPPTVIVNADVSVDFVFKPSARARQVPPAGRPGQPRPARRRSVSPAPPPLPPEASDPVVTPRRTRPGAGGRPLPRASRGR